jgi:hypothetical protein
MGVQKLTGAQAILGGAIILNPTTTFGLPKFYDARTSAGMTDSQGGFQVGKMKFYVKRLTLTGADFSTTSSIADTGWDVPFGAIIDDAWIDTRVAASSAGNTIAVGVAGSGNNLLNAWAAVAAFQPTPLAGYGSGLLGATTTYKVKVPYNMQASTTRSVTWTRSATTFTTTFSGNLYISYRLPTT